MLHKILKSMVPIAAMILASGCNGTINIGGSDGVPLSELDTTGKTPVEVVLAGPDDVVVARGDTFDISVSGDDAAIDELRFTLDDETLGIMRESDGLRSADGKAMVRVTLPRVEKLVLAGSGTIEADMLDGDAEVTIAGSGTARTARVDVGTLNVTIAGSGTYRAAGRVDSLELKVAGSGKAEMDGLRVGNAEITIAGAGDAAFASDGTVEATIMGSGDVTVSGSARCTVNTMGSGTLTCKNGNAAGTADNAAPSPPEPPVAPEPPAAPEPPQAPQT